MVAQAVTINCAVMADHNAKENRLMRAKTEYQTRE
jgi:hypothetical protein